MTKRAKRRFLVALIPVVFLAGVDCAHAHSQRDQAPASHWETYRSQNYNFLFQYPRDWSASEGYDRNGVTLVPKNKTGFHSSVEIGAGGHVGQPSSDGQTHLETLDEDLASRLKALKEYAHAQRMVILAKQRTRIQGYPGIISTIEYDDPSTGRRWFDKTVLIHTPDDRSTYDMVLHCAPEDRSIAEPVFDGIAKTFRIEGPPA